MAKKNDKVEIEVIGGNCENVTGSCSKITFQKHTYLFELGMIQDGKTVLDNYRANTSLLQKIKSKDIEVIMVGHMHIDHIGLIPALYKSGKCTARIIIPAKSTSILREMWLDSAFINERDAEQLSYKDEKSVQPLYTTDDVYTALQYVEEFNSHNIHNITENLSIRYTPAGHILLSQQTEVFINGGSHTRKILFTSDLGNVSTQNSRIFAENFEPVAKANIVIGECTYCDGSRKPITEKVYSKDVAKIKTVIDQYCLDTKGRVLIPVFSLDRTPYMLWIIYELFGKDENFNVPVIIDSPLAIRLLNCYSSILEGDAKVEFDEMMSWKNLKLIVTPEDSKAAIASKQSMVVLSSSGMLTAGRSVKWTQSVLPRAEDCILFCGYSGENTLSWKIKNYQEQKTITINGKPYKNKANIVDLHSFSSHQQRNDMIDYYKSINCEKIYLVHGDKNKLSFKEDLQKAITNECKSTRVIATNKSTKISL